MWNQTSWAKQLVDKCLDGGLKHDIPHKGRWPRREAWGISTFKTEKEHWIGKNREVGLHEERVSEHFQTYGVPGAAKGLGFFPHKMLNFITKINNI